MDLLHSCEILSYIGRDPGGILKGNDVRREREDANE